MRVQELRHLAEQNQNKTCRIYNPDSEDFTVNYLGQPVTVKSMEITELNVNIANHVKKHLADHLLHKRGVKSNVEDDLKEINKELEVNL